MRNEIPLIALRPVAPSLRRRAPGDRSLYAVPTDHVLTPETAQIFTFRQMTPGFLFFSSILAFLCFGIASALVPPEAGIGFGGHSIPSGAECVRVTRHADYVSAEIAIGSPMAIISVLLRMDTIVEPNVNTSNLHVFSSRVAESDTVACDGSICEDVMLVQVDGPRSEQRRAVGSFVYSALFNEEYVGAVAYEVGLRGELRLAYGHDHYLTATHFCWAPSALSDGDLTGGVSADAASGVLMTNASDMSESRLFARSPAGKAQAAGKCANSSLGWLGEVHLFPGAAADESAWLGLGSDRAYETSPEGLDDRREVVEVGTNCASSDAEYARAYSLYRVDCLSWETPCETTPSVPFRRVADAQLRVHVASNGNARVWASSDPRLRTLPKLEDATEAFWLSVVKLFAMTLAAAVVWIRAAKSTASHDTLFMHCARLAHCGDIRDSETISEAAVWEDALIGLVAIAARVAVAVWRVDTLQHDGQARAAICQLVAGGMSLLQWFVRYFVLQRHCESPLTKLGGSTAIVDASTAVMLAFSEPPLLVSSLGRFDPTARLLTALLLTIVVVQRCAFAAACCGLLWAVAIHDGANYKPSNVRWRVNGLFGTPSPDGREPRFGAAYVPILLAAAICWVAQAGAVGVLLADVFATPLAFSASREIAGEWRSLSLAFFLAVTAAACPQMMRSARKIAEASVKETKETKK